MEKDLKQNQVLSHHSSPTVCQGVSDESRIKNTPADGVTSPLWNLPKIFFDMDVF
jgi:hypothetical protein